jgi:hypothetical protein
MSPAREICVRRKAAGDQVLVDPLWILVTLHEFELR